MGLSTNKKKALYKKWWFWLIIVLILIVVIEFAGGTKETTNGFTVDEYTTRVKDAVKGTGDLNITLEDENIIINTAEKELKATYMLSNNSGILYKEDGMYLVVSDLDIAMLGDSINNMARIFIGTVDNSLSMGEREKTIQNLGFNADNIEVVKNEVLGSTQTDNYKFSYMYNAESNTRVIKAESK